MRPILTLMGGLLLAGNLVFAAAPRPTVTQVRNEEQAEREVRRQMAMRLVERGLEPAAAHAAVMHLSERLALHLFHFSVLFPEIDRQALLAHGADAALRGERFDLRSYDRVVSVLQRLHGPVLPDSMHVRAAHCVLMNRMV